MVQTQENPENRIAVAKTYKIYIDGKFPRTESGRYYPLSNADGFTCEYLPQQPQGFSQCRRRRRGASAGWSAASAYLRGQILYRIAEMLEGRREQFVAELRLQGELQSARDRGNGCYRPADLFRRLVGQVSTGFQFG